MSKLPHNWKWLGYVFRIVATVVLLGLVVRLAAREDFSVISSRITPPEVAVLLLGFAAVHFGGLCKWRLLAGAADATIPFVYAAQCYATGLFGNIFLPSNIGGDMVSTGMAMRRSSNKVGIVMATVASRMLDLSSLVLITLAGVLHPGTWSLVVGHKPHLALAGAAFCVVLGAMARPVLHIPRFVPFRWRRPLVSVRRVIRSMAKKPLAFAVSFALSLTLQLSLLLLNFWVGTLCGLHVPLAGWLFAWPVAKLIAFIPISQGGFGTREFALAGLLAPFSARSELVVAVGLVWDVLLVIAGLSGGLVALLLARMSRAPAPGLANGEARRGTA